ncbi:MAG: NAD(+) diphosphatase [Spirochaetes bacterium]|nr:NAD(+) diphosphatase [Spirochaetota bacterium]
MIHEIFPHNFSNLYLLNNNIEKNDYIIYYKDNSLLLRANGDKLELPRKKDFPEIKNETEKTFLFSLNNIPCFLIWDNLNSDKPGFVFTDINFFRTTAQQEIAWISITGFHIMNWYSENKYCGKCGSQTQQKIDERALECPECCHVIYPKISPAIIVAIISNDKLLLARNANFPVKWYSLIAGYADIGESLEETVIREVKEEVGLDIKNIRYYKSQPWPLSGSMMIGFIAEADDSQPIVIDNKEIADAAWFTRGSLPDYPPNLSIAGEMIEKYEKGEL